MGWSGREGSLGLRWQRSESAGISRRCGHTSHGVDPTPHTAMAWSRNTAAANSMAPAALLFHQEETVTSSAPDSSKGANSSPRPHALHGQKGTWHYHLMNRSAPPS